MLKTAILLPKEYQNTLEFFPFLCALQEYEKHEEIHILTSNDIDCFEALPFDVSVHKVNEQDLGVIKNYKVAYRLKDIFNLDSFYNLRGDLNTLTMGKAFKAKTALSFKNSLSFLFYKETIKNSNEYAKDAPYLKLLEKYSEQNLSDYVVNNKYEDKGYFIIACDDLDFNGPYHQTLNKFISELKDKNIFLWSKETNEVHQSLVNDFDYLNYVKEVDSKFLREARGVITNHEYLAHLSRFNGQDHILWVDDLKSTQHYEHFSKPLGVMSLDELGQGVYLNGNDEDTINELEKALDLILKAFKL